LKKVHEPPPNASPELLKAYEVLNDGHFDSKALTAEIIANMQQRLGRAEEALSKLHLRNGLPEPESFGPSDLVYGPTAGGELAELARKLGGKTLQDYGTGNGFAGGDWKAFTKKTLDEWARANDGRMVRFDLTHMADIEDVLANTGARADATTSIELRHIRDHWETFKNSVKFYRGGIEVPPPWLKDAP
jgi:hypothetical protein